MLAAQLKGKLTFEEERLEDLLTSNVFGSLSYIKPDAGLLAFLKKARMIDGNNYFIDLPLIDTVEYEFWPNLNNPVSCQPDVVIRLYHQDKSISIVMVESKYFSRKSSLPTLDGSFPTDQLAKQWLNLENLSKQEKAIRYCLLYATADYVMPIIEINESQEELESKCGKRANLAWVSWRVLPDLLVLSKEKILSDLGELLLKQGLDVFKGFGLFKSHRPNIQWTFYKKQLKKYKWKTNIIKLNWRFKEKKVNFSFNTKFIKIKWRFRK